MPRLSIRNFSGGLVTNQSEFDLQDSQYQTFEKIVNKKQGRIEKPKVKTLKSATEAGSEVASEIQSYRTEKDASDNDTSTVWWIVGNGENVKRQDVSTGTGGSWASVSSGFSGTPIYDFLIHNQVLRLTDGSFANDSKWYGHIKRDVLGNNLDVTTNIPKYKELTRKTAYNGWFLKDAEISAPTIVKMSMAHDGSDELSSNDDVGIFVYEPRHGYDTNNDLENDEHNAWDNAMDNETFDPSDRYAFTYLYDYVQESELSRDGDGNIGVSGFEVEKGSDEETDSGETTSEALTETEQDIDVSDGTKFTQYSYIKIDQEIMFIKYISSNTLYVRRGQLDTQIKEHVTSSSIFYRSSPQKARAINVVLNGITASGYHNPRITGLNIYWQPKGDPDWYLVETMDMNRCYADSPLASSPDTQFIGSSNLAKFYQTNIGHSRAMRNFGYWMPCPYKTALDDVESASFTFGDGVWTGTANDFSNTSANNIAILSRKESGDSGTTMATQFNRLGSYYCEVDHTGVSDEQINFGYNATGAGNDINRVLSRKNNNVANIDEVNRITTHAEELTKATTWYIPFDGLKLATYNSLTGRAEKTKVNAIKWNTSTTMYNRGYYADVDTKDENEQTEREKNRVYFTDPYKLDEIYAGRYFDVGRNDGDSIQRIMEYRGRLFVFKTKNTYVYNERHQVERHYVGVGADNKGAVFETPLGLVCANKYSVSVVTPNTVKELTYQIRDTWQGLTLDNPKVGYDAIDNEIIVAYDYNGANMYVMNADNGSWILRDITTDDLISNFILNNDLRPEYLIYNNPDYDISELNTGALATTTGKIKSKRFDFGLPDQEKRFSKIHLVYQAPSDVTFNVYINGNSSPNNILTFSAQSTLGTASQPLSALGQSIEIEISCAGNNFMLDSIDIDYEVLGSNP